MLGKNRMNIRILTIGKISTSFVKEGVALYSKRLVHYGRIEVIELPDVKQKEADLQKEKEGELFLKQLRPEDYVVLLDEKGETLSSREFAQVLQKRMNSGVKVLYVLIGGAFGFSKEVYERADAQWSLSKMTFNHEMARLFLFEQLYRAHTILKGEKYHND